MMHRDERQDKRERLKVGFWSDFISFPLWGLIVVGVLFLVAELFPSEDAVRRLHWAWPILLIVTGIALLFVQRRKLRFRTLGTPADLERFKTEVREIMAADGWDIDYDNKRFMRAVYRRRDGIPPFYLDMVTLRFRGRTVLYNVVNHPDQNNSGLPALFSPCRRGRRLITEIGGATGRRQQRTATRRS